MWRKHDAKDNFSSHNLYDGLCSFQISITLKGFSGENKVTEISTGDHLVL